MLSLIMGDITMLGEFVANMSNLPGQRSDGPTN